MVGPAAGVAAGERVLAAGTLAAGSFHLGSGPVAGEVEARVVQRLGPAEDPLFATGNVLRRRVLDGVAAFGSRPAAALLAGFLIGDTSRLPDADAEALRLAGLSHFVAVSGSNVALFLTAWWLASGPLGWGPRRRAVLGLVGLAVFIVVTRWEPSVVRAATMAALVLGGRLAGRPVDGWTALGGSVTLLLLVSGDMAGDAGFQLSVAATAGVLAGGGLWRGRRPRWAWTALGATVSAQAAVAPLLLVHFGSVPLFAPLTNVISAPLVAGATALGGVGVVAGATPLTGVALLAADAVLAVARFGRDLPQLDWGGVGVVAAAGALALRPRLRPLVALGGVLAVAALALPSGGLPTGPKWCSSTWARVMPRCCGARQARSSWWTVAPTRRCCDGPSSTVGWGASTCWWLRTPTPTTSADWRGSRSTPRWGGCGTAARRGRRRRPWQRRRGRPGCRLKSRRWGGRRRSGPSASRCSGRCGAIDARAFGQLGFLLEERDQGRGVGFLEDAQRVRLEGHGDRGAVNRVGLLDDLVEEGLVPDVDSVEISDGDDSPFEGRLGSRLKALYQLHSETLSVGEQCA